MTLVKFFSTSHIAGAWPTAPKLYPTYILLIVSLISLCIDLLHLGASYCGSASARKADRMVSKLRYAIMVIQAVASATGTGVFNGTKSAGTGQDLFGWTCSSAADNFSAVNSSDLVCNSNVSQLPCGWSSSMLHKQLTCNQQTSSAYISILKASLHALGIIITIVTMIGPKMTTNTDKKPSKTGKASAPKTTLGSRKPSGAKTPSEKDSKEPEDNTNMDADLNPKPEGSQPDKDAITNFVNQSQDLYSRLQGEDRTDSSADQTKYADVDMTSRQADYTDFDMQRFR